MAIQVQGSGGSIVGSAEGASQPLHVVEHPLAGNFYRYAGCTGTIAAALAANSEVLQFRFLSGTKSFAVVTKVQFDGLGIVAVGTAIGPLGFMLKPARAWTVAGSGGTRIATSGDNLQLRTAAANSQVNDLGIATTGALTVGTKTKDANSIGQAIGGILTGAATTSQAAGDPIMPQPLLRSDGGGSSPLILANQEGFTIDTTHVGPAALTYTAGFTVEWVEVTTI